MTPRVAFNLTAVAAIPYTLRFAEKPRDPATVLRIPCVVRPSVSATLLSPKIAVLDDVVSLVEQDVKKRKRNSRMALGRSIVVNEK